MIIVHSDDHQRHCELLDPRGDDWHVSDECPERANSLIRAIRERNFGELVAPRSFEESRLTAIHAPDYVNFLKTVWQDWVDAGMKSMNARPDTFVGTGMRHVETKSVVGRLGRYSFDSTSPFVAGSWQAIRTSANIAMTAAETIREGAQHAFALCRPPGHHAAANFCGGYCYLNNAALAAQLFLDGGSKKVVILDVDYHHSNGTQSIFYARDDVLTVSLHADPGIEYPFFLGYADETGEKAGESFNVNYPLPFGTDWKSYRVVLDDALRHVRDHAADVLIVSLGLDTFVDDPSTYFELTSEDYLRLGNVIGALGMPTLVVLEGGYSVSHIGQNTLNVLSSIEEA